MKAPAATCLTPSLDGPQGPSRARKWANLALALGLTLVLALGLGALILDLPFYKPMKELVEATGIKPTAFYWTAVEEVGEADRYMDDSFRFPPRDPDKKP